MFDPRFHHRRSIRLKEYDYSREGAYFITICCKDKECNFGKIDNNEMILNENGIVAYNEWNKLPDRFPNVDLDVFQVMPNHIHGIITLTNVGAGLAPTQPTSPEPTHHVGVGFTPTQPTDGQHIASANVGQPQGIAPTLGDIIGSYKSLTAKAGLEQFKQRNADAFVEPYMGKLWQRNYYEHIIRSQESYNTISL